MTCSWHQKQIGEVRDQDELEVACLVDGSHLKVFFLVNTDLSQQADLAVTASPWRELSSLHWFGQVAVMEPPLVLDFQLEHEFSNSKKPAQELQQQQAPHGLSAILAQRIQLVPFSAYCPSRILYGILPPLDPHSHVFG